MSKFLLLNLKKEHSHVFVEVNCNQRYIIDDLDI